MKHLSIALIFWLSIWTAPKAAGTDWPGWTFRVLVLAWGFYLCQKILNRRAEL